MVKVIIKAKGARIGEKILSVTRKCMELAPEFDCFGWEFFKSSNGNVCFHASCKQGDKLVGEFEMPVNSYDLAKEYPAVIRELDELKWSALFWKKEEHG